MKKYNLLTIILFTSCSFTFAQSERFKKAEISNRIEIEGDINFAWIYLSNLGNLQNLVPSTIQSSIATGYGIGSSVTLTLTNNKGIIKEEVIKLNNKTFQITYKMTSSPLPIKNYVAGFALKKIAVNKFEVAFDAKFKVQDINRKARLEAFNKLQLELLTNIKKKTDENK
ncbi:MAG: SRPBCC family protein [Methylotenera sp.]|nr:SRPBCC family protein [Flavobacterium sp.]